jgi:hypothetical protein
MISEGLYVENLKLVYDFQHIEGCVVECGVWQGGMIAGIAEILTGRNYHLFDSFEGLPDAKNIDGAKAIEWQKNKDSEFYHNNCTADIEVARKTMEMSKCNYKIYKGWFENTLHKVDFIEPIAVLRLDADWYDSTYEAMRSLYPKVSKGGLIIIDDYFTWDGCSRAIHYFLNEVSSTSRIHKSKLGLPYIIKSD